MAPGIATLRKILHPFIGQVFMPAHLCLEEPCWGQRTPQVCRTDADQLHWLQEPSLPVVPTMETVRSDDGHTGIEQVCDQIVVSMSGKEEQNLLSSSATEFWFSPATNTEGFWILLWTPSRRVLSDLQLPKGIRYFSCFCSCSNS